MDDTITITKKEYESLVSAVNHWKHTYPKYLEELNLNLRSTLIDVALSIDWDQQDASRFFIGEDAADSVLFCLGFDWNLGLSNDSVNGFLKLQSKET